VRCPQTAQKTAPGSKAAPQEGQPGSEALSARIAEPQYWQNAPPSATSPPHWGHAAITAVKREFASGSILC
jgi:hypothetical protein